MELVRPLARLSGPVLWASDPTGNRLQVRVISVDKENNRVTIVQPNGGQSIVPREWLYTPGGKSAKCS